MSRSEAPPGSVRCRRPKFAARVRESALWKTPRSAFALIVSIETLCVTWLCVANLSGLPSVSGLGRFILLFFVALVYAVGANKIELLRRYVAEVTFASVASLWCMAAALILPVGLAGAFAALLYGHALIRIIRTKSGRPFQQHLRSLDRHPRDDGRRQRRGVLRRRRGPHVRRRRRRHCGRARDGHLPGGPADPRHERHLPRLQGVASRAVARGHAQPRRPDHGVRDLLAWPCCSPSRWSSRRCCPRWCWS